MKIVDKKGGFYAVDRLNGDKTQANGRQKFWVNSFIDKIYIGAPHREDKKRLQEVKIVYKLIGAVNISQ